MRRRLEHAYDGLRSSAENKQGVDGCTDDEFSAVVCLHTRTSFRDVSVACWRVCYTGTEPTCAYLGLSLPHHTPATTLTFPFPLHAPSEYTMSHPLSSWITSVDSTAHVKLELCPFSCAFSSAAVGLSYGFVLWALREDGSAGIVDELDVEELPLTTPCCAR